ncbi:MAG: ABC transporter substrate-binding protein [Propionibacteriaceae bacterium]
MSFSRRHLLGATGGVAAATVGLAGCGSNTGREPAGSTPSASGSAPKPKLSQWYHEYGEAGVEDAVKKYAAAYPDATVTVKWNPGDYEKLVGAALLTSKVPDVFEYANGPTLDMIKAGQVEDMTATIGDAMKQLNQGIIKPRLWQDKLYSIPQTIDMQMLYYRKSVLEKAHVKPPTTLAELVDAAKAVKTKDMGGFFAGNDSGLGVLGQLFIWAAGLDMFSSDKKEIGFNDPAFYSGLTAYKAFRDSGALLQSASADWFDAAPFNNGETAMQWTGLWVLPLVKDALADDFGVVPFPAIGSSGRVAVAAGAYSACVSSKGTNPEAAKAFSKWLWIDQEDDQVEFSTAFGAHIPVKPALAAKADKLASGAGADAAKMVADNGHVPDLLWSPTISTGFSSAVSNVVLKGANPKSEFDKVAATAKKEIARLTA